MVAQLLLSQAVPETLNPAVEHSPIDQEALIREARRRQRRRRLNLLVVALVLVGAGVAVWQLAFSSISNGIHRVRPVKPVAPPPRLTLHLLGWGSVVQGFAPGTSCPDGVTSVPIRFAGTTIGSVSECDLVVSKVDKPDWGVWSTHANMLATYHIPGGTILTHEQRSFRFSRQSLNSTKQVRTRGTFSGRIIGGSGRYAHARGSISGGGPGANNSAHWTIVFHFH